jgi:hypothetical protein
MGSLRSIRHQDYVLPKDRNWENCDRRKNALKVMKSVEDIFISSKWPKLRGTHMRLYEGMPLEEAKRERKRVISFYEAIIFSRRVSDKAPHQDFGDVRAEILYQFRKTLSRLGLSFIENT